MGPTFRLILFAVALGAIGYGSTRVHWDGQPAWSHGLDGMAWVGKQAARGWAWTGPARTAAWVWAQDRVSEGYTWVTGPEAAVESEPPSREADRAPRQGSDAPAVAASAERAKRLQDAAVAAGSAPDKPRLDRPAGARERAMLDRRLREGR